MGWCSPAATPATLFQGQMSFDRAYSCLVSTPSQKVGRVSELNYGMFSYSDISFLGW